MEQQKYQQSRSFSPFALLNKKQSRARDLFPFLSFAFFLFCPVAMMFCVKSFPFKENLSSNNTHCEVKPTSSSNVEAYPKERYTSYDEKEKEKALEKGIRAELL
jgi:hypothetical protein